MRTPVSAVLGLALLGCSTAPEPVQRSAAAEQRLRQELAGKAAGPAIDCLPTYQRNDMVSIDESTILFRAGRNRVYVNRVNGRCAGLGSAGYALVTKHFGDSRLCRGDIAQVVDVSSGITAGSCVIGDFVPYTRP